MRVRLGFLFARKTERSSEEMDRIRRRWHRSFEAVADVAHPGSIILRTRSEQGVTEIEVGCGDIDDLVTLLESEGIQARSLLKDDIHRNRRYYYRKHLRNGN